MQRTSKRLISLLGLVLIVFLVGYFVLSYKNSFQILDISFSDTTRGITASIYRVPNRNHEAALDSLIKPNNLVKELRQNSTMKLKKDDYLLVTSDSSDYSNQQTEFSLGDIPQKLVINPDFTDKKLTALLIQENPVIQQVIQATFPGIINNYTTSHGHLYKKGEWFTALVSIKQTEEQRRTTYTDIYRLVAHKDGGTWKIVTIPPELIISGQKYPAIPKDILRDLNKQTL